MTETDAVRIAATLEHLSRLVSFPSLPGQSNRDLLGYVTAALEQAGVESVCTFHGDGERGNLVAMIGPRCGGGVMLNGHTDVVPVDGQTWRSDPFTLRVEDGRAFARGAVDMKGFLACLLAMAPRFAAADLARPVIYAMTFDEEIGGEGAGLLAPPLEDHPLKPACCIVGEPTGLAIVGGCKGGIELRTEISGLSAHASDPRRGANAIYAAGRLIAEIEAIARRYASVQIHDSPFDPSYTTLNVGTIVGGSARNAVPDNCVVDWEIRPVSPEHGDAILEAIETLVAEEILPGLRDAFPEAEMRTRIEALVPPLSPPGPDDPALALARVLTGQEAVGSVSFGTDAGYFQQVGIPTIVCGPGTLETAHMPDEHIRIDELAAGLGMLERLAGNLAR